MIPTTSGKTCNYSTIALKRAVSGGTRIWAADTGRSSGMFGRVCIVMPTGREMAAELCSCRGLHHVLGDTVRPETSGVGAVPVVLVR